MKVVIILGKIVTFLTLTGVLLVVYAIVIEPHSLMVNEYKIESNEIQGMNYKNNKLTIIQLSDLEISQNYTEKQLKKIVERINAKNPDFVFFTGDLFENYALYKPTKEIIKALKDIRAVYGKYSIWGNNDYGGGAVRVYETIMEQSGFQVLRNEGVNVELTNGEKIFIGGLDDQLLGKPSIEKVMMDLDKESRFKILLLHEPDMIQFLKSDTFDLVLAGHSHGGQVNIQFIRKIFHIDTKYRAGFYKLEHMPKTKFYVNSGMGTSRMPIRFLVPPEIACFRVNL